MEQHTVTSFENGSQQRLKICNIFDVFEEHSTDEVKLIQEKISLAVKRQDSSGFAEQLTKASVFLSETLQRCRTMVKPVYTHRSETQSYGAQKSSNINTVHVDDYIDSFQMDDNLNSSRVNDYIDSNQIDDDSDSAQNNDYINSQIADNLKSSLFNDYIDSIQIDDDSDSVQNNDYINSQIDDSDAARVTDYMNSQIANNIDSAWVNDYYNSQIDDHFDSVRVNEYINSFHINDNVDLMQVDDNIDTALVHEIPNLSSDSEDDMLTVHFVSNTVRNVCCVCHTVFASVHLLNRHEKTHFQDRPFKCTECSYAANTKHRLKLHMFNHTMDKPLKCGLCDYSCVQSKSLKLHLQLHTDENAFKCGICKYSTARSQELQYHYKHHHVSNTDSGRKSSEDHVRITDRGCKSSEDHVRITDRGHKSSEDHVSNTDRGNKSSEDHVSNTDSGRKSSEKHFDLQRELFNTDSDHKTSEKCVDMQIKTGNIGRGSKASVKHVDIQTELTNTGRGSKSSETHVDIQTELTNTGRGSKSSGKHVDAEITNTGRGSKSSGKHVDAEITNTGRGSKSAKKHVDVQTETGSTARGHKSAEKHVDTQITNTGRGSKSSKKHVDAEITNTGRGSKSPKKHVDKQTKTDNADSVHKTLEKHVDVQTQDPYTCFALKILKVCLTRLPETHKYSVCDLNHFEKQQYKCCRNEISCPKTVTSKVDKTHQKNKFKYQSNSLNESSKINNRNIETLYEESPKHTSVLSSQQLQHTNKYLSMFDDRKSKFVARSKLPKYRSYLKKGLHLQSKSFKLRQNQIKNSVLRARSWNKTKFVHSQLKQKVTVALKKLSIQESNWNSDILAKPKFLHSQLRQKLTVALKKLSAQELNWDSDIPTKNKLVHSQLHQKLTVAVKKLSVLQESNCNSGLLAKKQLCRHNPHDNVDVTLKSCIESKKNEKVYTCEICNCACTSFKRLKTHLYQHGSDVQPYRHDMCDYSFSDPLLLTSNQSKCQTIETLSDQEMTNINCEQICCAMHGLSSDCSIKLQPNLANHMEDNDCRIKSKLYRCVACYFKCEDVQLMKKHLSTCDIIMNLW